MAEVDYERVKGLAKLSRKELGSGEEEVKINFAVPLLEALGHSRLRFEHRNKDVILREGLPPSACVVVETKRYGQPLDRHLAQLERYAAEERCFLAVLTNGDELRIYAPLWVGAVAFADALVRSLRREELVCAREVFELGRLLGANSLASGEAARAVAEQQARLNGLRAKADAIREGARRQREPLEGRLRAIEEQAAALDAERQSAVARLAAVAKEESETLRCIYGAAGVRVPRAWEPAAEGEEPPTPKQALRDDVEREPWTDDELSIDLADYQRRILEAFVRAGSRRLPLKEITKAVGLSPQQTWGALSRFTLPVTKGCKEPFLEVVRPRGKPRSQSGAVVEIVEKYWGAVMRLHGGG